MHELANYKTFSRKAFILGTCLRGGLPSSFGSRGEVHSTKPNANLGVDHLQIIGSYVDCCHVHSFVGVAATSPCNALPVSKCRDQDLQTRQALGPCGKS